MLVGSDPLLKSKSKKTYGQQSFQNLAGHKTYLYTVKPKPIANNEIGAGLAEKPRLLFLHGIDGAGETYKPVAEELAGRYGYTVILPDLPGSHRTRPLNGKMKLSSKVLLDWGGELAGMCAAINQDFWSIDHSGGAHLHALLLSSYYNLDQTFKGVIFYNPFGFLSDQVPPKFIKFSHLTYILFLWSMRWYLSRRSKDYYRFFKFNRGHLRAKHDLIKTSLISGRLKPELVITEEILLAINAKVPVHVLLTNDNMFPESYAKLEDLGRSGKINVYKINSTAHSFHLVDPLKFAESVVNIIENRWA